MTIDLASIRSASSLCRATYAYSGDATTQWDYWDNGTISGVVWGAKKIDGVWFISFRGSVRLIDWIKDAEAIAVWCDALQAHVHPGFNWRMELIWQKIAALVGDDPWIACGHSLGAARADNATAYAIKNGHPPIECVVFGEPRPGWKDFCDLVAQAPRVSFINTGSDGEDIVPGVPLDLDNEPYQRPSPLLPFTVIAQPFDGVDFFRFHHMQLYDDAAQKIITLPSPMLE